ncbi:unnamed protein product [Heterosigma akashiwo]
MSMGGFEYGNGGGYNNGGFGGNDAMGSYGGGGFMGDGQQDGGFGSSQSPSGKGKQDHTMKPCTIKQLMDATNDGSDTFRVDGQEVTQVMLVGCVIEKVERSTNTSWIIEDGTGRMEVMMYQDDAGANPVAEERRAACMQNTMVRAVGNFREFQGKRNVLAFDVQPLKDFNEVGVG